MVITLIVFLVVAGAGLAVAATFMLAGLPWAMLAGGAVLIALAFGLRRGVTNE